MTTAQVVTLCIFIAAVVLVGVLYAITWIQSLIKRRK
jgi:hypothetical protein